MLELAIVIGLGGVFWNYGKEMGTGKWMTLGIFLLAYIGLATMGLGLLSPICAAIITSILAMLLSCMGDQKKKQAVLERQARAKSGACPSCSEPIVGPQRRCNKCGLSFVLH